MERHVIRALLLVAGLLASTTASAGIDPKCEGIPQPNDYNEQRQQDFLQNYFALGTSYSPVHAPVPHKAGTGAIALGLSVIPPLSCEKRYVLDWTKTEETNKMPVMPRPVVSFALPVQGDVIPYASVSYLPPVPVAGTRNVFFGAEAGVGWQVSEAFELGLRGHATSLRTIADVATAFEDDGPVVLDYYAATTFGFDLIVGARIGTVAPYASIGLIDVSTFFLVGDDNAVIDNRHPYIGPALSVGADALISERWRLGLEGYAATGGVRTLVPSDPVVGPANGYGKIVTARLRFGFEFGVHAG